MRKEKISPEEKANDMLSRKMFEDAEKDILQILMLCDTDVQSKYWKEVHENLRTLDLIRRSRLRDSIKQQS